MAKTTVTKSIDASQELVFRTVAQIENFSKAVPHIVKVEFLSDVRYGVGARFRETRIMMRREASTVLEVTEHVENERVRLVSDQGGTIWDSLFTVKPVGDGVELKLEMDARPYTFKSRIVTPLIKGMIRKGIARDMDAVKEYCENQ